MNYTDKHLDQIDDYLSRPGRKGHPPQVTPDVSSDPALNDAFHDVEMLWQATRLERLQGKLTMLKEYEKEIQGEGKAPSALLGTGKAKETKTLKVVSISRTRWILSAAAGVLLLAAVGWFLFRPQEPVTIQNQYLAMHFDEYLQHDVMKGDAVTKEYTPEQLRAYNLFAIKDFKKAMPLLKKEWEEKGDTLALFYIITIQLGTEGREAGLKLLEEKGSVLSPEQRDLLDPIKG